jgi:hypothetical protein
MNVARTAMRSLWVPARTLSTHVGERALGGSAGSRLAEGWAAWPLSTRIPLPEAAGIVRLTRLGFLGLCWLKG